MQLWLFTLIITVSALSCCASASNSKQTNKPYTSFQTPTQYRADNDIRTDAVIVYSDGKENIQTWKDKGYVVQTMYGFRTGPEYIKQHPDEVQTMSDGTLHTCGPNSYYMVPTPNRIKAAVDYFTRAIDNGTSAVIPEEPESFAVTGYSESFKKAWQEYYKEPWQDQTTSIVARYKSERLKAKMQYDMVRAILGSAEKQNPNVTRMVACHSPVSYFAWGIIYPHYQCLTLPSLQEIIGQVWTGTARTACRYEGLVQERTFENALLEYSSLYNLARGSGKRMWFLMDPLEDNPDRTMEDYHTNYEKTLIASLMFPEVDAYEVMPWPTRIYGRVPAEFATQISTVINVLQDMHNQEKVAFDTGTRVIATFVADSMGWQRGAPHKSDYDCFYGLTLPLIYRGIPIQVAQLERAPVKGYLDQYKVLFVSYDILKPMSPAYNKALADWVKAGGVMVFFGGTDAYNDLPEWWRDRGFASPQADLYSRMGIEGNLNSLYKKDETWTQVLRANERIRNSENRNVYKLDLGPFAQNGVVYVRLRDAFNEDGWGSLLQSVRLVAGDEVLAQFQTGTQDEAQYIYDDGNSHFNGTSRFADGDNYWVYKFEVPSGSAPVLELDLANQFLVEVASDVRPATWRIRRNVNNALTSEHPLFEVPSKYPLTTLKAMHKQFYRAQDEVGSVMFEQAVGKGTLIHMGISPAYFASSKESADVLRSITAYACEKAGLQYKEQGRFGIRRGKYVAIRTFDETKPLQGRYVNLLDPKLEVSTDPQVGPDKCALYCDVTSRMQSDKPGLLYASGRIESLIESADTTEIKISGPQGTRGAVRLYTAGKSVASVPDGVNVDESGDSVLLSYDNNPDAVDLKINWR